MYEEWLTQQRGSRVQVRVPQRGDKRELLETVTRNAKEEFTRHRLRRAGRPQHAGPGRSTSCRTPSVCPRRRCASSATTWPTSRAPTTSARWWCWRTACPSKSEYRRFKVKGVAGNDDYAAMEEVLTRRLTAYLDERDRPSAERAAPASSPTRRSCCSSTAARASWPWPSGCVRRPRARRRDPGGVAGQAVRGGVRARPGRPGRHPRGSPRRCSCCSASATRPTASPTRSTASCGASG